MAGLLIYQDLSKEQEFKYITHYAEGLFDPNLRYKKTVTGFRSPRTCRFRKYQFKNRS
jgi:hypothetical protein